jgi:hypothetical protein
MLRSEAACGGKKGGQAAAVRRHCRVLSGRDEGVDATTNQAGSATGPARESELRIEVLRGFRMHVGARMIPEAAWGR